MACCKGVGARLSMLYGGDLVADRQFIRWTGSWHTPTAGLKHLSVHRHAYRCSSRNIRHFSRLLCWPSGQRQAHQSGHANPSMAKIVKRPAKGQSTDSEATKKGWLAARKTINNKATAPSCISTCCSKQQ